MSRFTRNLFVLALLSAMYGWLPNLQADDAQRLRQLLDQARQAAAGNNHAQAVELLGQAIAIDANNADLFRGRGRANFQAGRIEASVKDFDRVAELAPAVEKTLWERGISMYYASEFDRGAKQFELYQTYHDADVENATWRYLCVARADDVAKARESLLPIKDDRRVPMMKIYALYQGKATVDDVFAAAKAGEPGDAELNQRLFYAHLYVGLFHEAAGKADEAKKHIAEAVAHPIGHYMHDVARVHQELLKQDGFVACGNPSGVDAKHTVDR